jgi:dolichol-phosphate mannosyltransferase/undecaprenyl-phosphate 4-deoxy-4-formamido-L-arabinose transferase
MKQLCSIVIPVYNTTKSLIEICNRVSNTFQNSPQYCFEIIFVDDGSPNPETWKTLEHLANKYSEVQAIQLMRNFGQQSATVCGLRLAKGEYIITMDDDLQHLPEEILQLLSKKEHDIVIGQFKEKKHGVFKRLMSKLKGYFDHIILGKPKHIQLSPFRLINRKTLDGMSPLMNSPYPFIPAMMFYVTKDVVGVEATHDIRYEGQTGYDLFKLLKMFSNLMISNSSFLLRVIGNLGLSISLLSFAMAFYFIYNKLFFSVNTTGWTSVMVSLLFIGGLLLFSIGVLGEYLIRIIQGIDQKPTYIIRNHASK